MLTSPQAVQRSGRRGPRTGRRVAQTAASTGSPSQVVQTMNPSTAASETRLTSSSAPVIGRIVIP